jgi:acyl-CoA thioesterase-2
MVEAFVPGFSVSVEERGPKGVSLLDVMDLETLDRDLFRSRVVFDEQWPLYGGQVCAQALVAAQRTVPDGRYVHSLQGYFLRPGQSNKPVMLHVERDRDGGTFSARRVVAIQDGEVILNLGASFQERRAGNDLTYGTIPELTDPEQIERSYPPRLISFDQRIPEQPGDDMVMPTRVWMRCTADLPSVADDPHLHAALFTYMSDLYTGFGAEPSCSGKIQSTISHALWFHEPIALDEWILLDLTPEKATGGRALYNGRLWSRSGQHVGSLVQESLYVDFRPRAT